MAIHTPTPPARAGERARSPKSQIGPVTQALRVMLAADPDQPRIRELRRSIADRIEADIALLDALDGDADLEQDAGEMPEIDVADEPHDAEEDQGAEEDDGFNGAVTFDGVNYGFRPFTLDRQVRR